ncbi:MAG: hypothetical protein U0837_10685 [Dehalococcoidia bacterium]|jgi:hypothetical protein
MSVAPGGSSSGGGSSANKVGALLLGGGLLAIIAIFGPRAFGDDDEQVQPAPTAEGLPSGGGSPLTPAPTAQPTARPQPTTRPTQTADEELRGSPDNVILTVTVYGMPGRVGAETIDRSIEIRQRQKGSCAPADQYPGPCVTYYVAKRGTAMRLYGGDSQAGYWPAIDYVSGAGCSISRPLIGDFSCPFTLESDMSVEAGYYGSEGSAPGTIYRYPNCPPSKPRCQ